MSGFTHESQCNESKEWYTPKSIFDMLKCTFTLDPASPGRDIVPWIPAEKHLTFRDNGLMADWTKEQVWCNPPYGQDTEVWMEKFIRSNCSGIMLVFARTDTRWFHNLAIYADILCFVKGRIKFVRGDGYIGHGCGAASLLIAKGSYGDSLKMSGIGFCVNGKENP
jgi:hypothetical protein